MSINVTLQNVATLQNASIVSVINANNSLITTGFSDCLSLSGQQPNQMQSNLDMNSFQVINLVAPATLNSPVRLIDLQNAVIGSFGTGIYGLLAGNNTWSGTNTFNSTVSGTGITSLFASPPNIGSTTAAAGHFTTLSASSTVSGTGFSAYLASPPAIGGTVSNTGTFTTLTANVSISTSAVFVPTLYGGTAAAATLLLQATNNVSPSGDIMTIKSSNFAFQNSAGTAVGDYNLSSAGIWTFSKPVAINGVSSTTALQVNGIAGSLFIDFNGGGSSYYSANTQIFRTFANTVVLDYNSSAGNTWTFGSTAPVKITSATASTTTTTGSLIISGGVGIAGAVFTGSTANHAGILSASSNVAIGTGSSPTTVILYSTTSGLGIYSGTGAPTFSSVAGSIYIRTDGGAATALYLCTGTTTWVAVT